MRDRSEDQRLDKYTSLDPIIEQYGNTCKRLEDNVRNGGSETQRSDI